MNSRHRLLFTKDGTSRFISHLDLMRTMQRAFLRAGLRIRHTEGFNPHAFVSVALPLPVGHASGCELLDFELMEETLLGEVPARMNSVLPEGLRILDAYVPERPLKELLYLRSRIQLQYDRGVPAGAGESLLNLFSAEQLIVTKSTKRKAETQVDLIPLIRSLECVTGENELTVTVVHHAQNPTLNPELIVAALAENLPALVPDFAGFRRLEVLDGELNLFR